MQNCFRQYPEVYGSELDSDAEDDEDELNAAAPAQDGHTAQHSTAEPSQAPTSAVSSNPEPRSPSIRTTSTSETGRAEKGKFANEPSSAPPSSDSRPGLDLVPDNYKPDAKSEHEPVSESESLVPKAAHDVGDAGTERLQRK
jgi:intermembrane space import and assembly protein 40